MATTDCFPMLSGPDGVFVDVIERIAPVGEYAAVYTGAEP